MNNFSLSIHERLIRVLIRRNPDLNYTDEELKENGVTRDELVTYKNTHPEILDTSDDTSLANFSERIKNAFKSKYPTDIEALNFLGDLGCTATNGNLMNESGILDHVRQFIDKYSNKDQTIFILNKLLNYTSDGASVECHVRREGVPKLKWALNKLGLNMMIYSGEFDFIHRSSAKGLDSIT